MEGKPTVYTSLKVERAQILRDVYHTRLLDIPQPTDRKIDPNRDKWCEFHKSLRHEIEDCLSWQYTKQEPPNARILPLPLLIKITKGRNHTRMTR
ncbi:hypothetical protein CR513_42954, partial [Mucuna pruriens]